MQSNVKYCQVCGSAVEQNAMFCPNCGETKRFSSTPPDRIERPLGVTLLGILQIIFSLGMFIIALTLITTGAASSTSSFAAFAPILEILGIMMLIPMIFAILFLMGLNFARILMIIGAILDILSIAGIIWGIIVLWYLTRPRVRAYFKQPRHRKTSEIQN